MQFDSNKLRSMINTNKYKAFIRATGILCLVAGFVLFSFSSVKAQNTSQNDTIIIDRILAVVGAHPILQSDVESALAQSRQAGVRIPGDEKCTMLEQIMESKLLLDQAELDSIEKTDREVEVALQRKLDYFINVAGSVEAIEESFKKSMPEIKQDFFDDVKEQLLTEEMKANLTADVKVTPSDVNKFFKQIPKNEIPRIPEQIEIRQIVIKPPIAEEERRKVIDRLNAFREEILAGKSMATLAILHSEDPGSGSNGGELGFLRRTDLVPEFTAVAFNLRPGETSRPVKTDYGYHLIQVIERKGEAINARHILLRPKVSEKTKKETRDLLDSIAIKIRDGELEFEKAALRFSTDEQTFANGGLMINMINGTTKFEPKELPAEMLSAMRNLKVGEISEPFESRDDNMNTVYKIISIKSKQDAHQADIKTDYQYIQQMTLLTKRNEALDEWLEDKLGSTFIRINKDYQGCQFRIDGWVK